MRIEQISIKTLIIGILLFIAIITFIAGLFAGSYFRETALDAQAKSLSRIIKIGTDEAIRQIQKESTDFGATLHHRGAVNKALNILKETGDTKQLVAQLDDSFIKGFAGMGAIDLVKLRVYDPDLKLLCESREGLTDLPPQLPVFLQTNASGRKGVERMKALNGLWISHTGPLHSQLVPLGGLHMSGYLEIIVNPNFSLAKVATLTKMPIKIYSPDDKLVYQSDQDKTMDHGTQLPVEYQLKTERGELAYRLVGMEDVAQYNKEISNALTLVRTILFTSGTLALLLVLWIFTHFMFRPINHMMNDIKRYFSEGTLTVTPHQGNVKEFHALSNAFSDMAKKIQGNIHELERLSRLDGLTGIPNRRSLDIGLDREWTRMQRNKSEISLLLMDIDFFKLYNDKFGHQGGDDCLKLVASAIEKAATRPGDLVARYGGEEFAVLLSDTSSKGAATVANHIIDAINKLQISHPDSSVSNIVTLSIGISTLNHQENLSPFHLVGLADEALYQAKAAGRNQIKTASSADIAKTNKT